MRRHLTVLALVMAAAVSACGADEPALVSESATQPQQASEPMAREKVEGQSAAPASTRREDVDRTADSRAERAVQHRREETPPTEASTAEEETSHEDAAQETEPPSAYAAAAAPPSEVEEAERETEQRPLDLMDVPATVLLDADVRIRPGLAWRVIDRLESGASVAVLHEADGWYRIRHGEKLGGWIRTTAHDLGAISPAQVPSQPAPVLIAGWQGERYGVMGRSADGVWVRLLNESAEILDAPISEVMLIDADVTLEDLPILIGDETVVFPGDDFRAGQGKILPKANEWLWLDDGTLLAHNDEYIWQWRPETDEVKFVRRPTGYARFSPGGESVAILTCGGEESCHPYLDVTILPLDGAPMVRLLDHAEVSQRLGGLKAIDIVSTDDFMWTNDRRGLLIPLVPRTAVLASAAALLHADRPIVILDPLSPSYSLPEHCRPAPSPRGFGWRLRSTDLVAFRVLCEDDAHELTAFYDATEQSITLGEADSIVRQDLGWEDELLAADDSNLLGEGFRALPNETERLVFVAVPQRRQLLIFEIDEGLLRPVADEQQAIPDWFWESVKLGSDSWDTYWSEHGQAVVVARWGQTHVAGVLLVDLASGIGEPVEIGAVQTWPCYPTGGWSPNGAIFQIEFEAFSTSERPDRFWIDGTAAPHGKVAQRKFVSSNGETLGLLRAIAHLKFSAPSHIAGWSPNGDRIAIGGHQNQHHCW